jgi:hypothetical protein
MTHPIHHSLPIRAQMDAALTALTAAMAQSPSRGAPGMFAGAQDSQLFK